MIVKINDYNDCPREMHLHLDKSDWVQRPNYWPRVTQIFAFVHDPDVGMLEGGYANVFEPEPRPVAAPTFWGRFRQYLSA